MENNELQQDHPILKIVVMNDLHLVSPGSTLPNMDTAKRFETALSNAEERHDDADLCIFAGDITDKAEPEAYFLFDALRTKYSVPQIVTLGNHDDRNVYLSCAKDKATDPNGFIQFKKDIKGHRILVLDSSEPGKLAEVFLMTKFLG